MKETMTSDTTGKTYCPSDSIRLVNMKQLAFYLKNNVEILDFYASKDFKTGEDIVVFVVDKYKSQPIYKMWLEARGNNE